MEIGQKVKIRRLRDRISPDVVSKIKQSSTGTITGYKMLDGSQVGFVVKLDNQFATWFFEDELEATS